MTNVAPIAPCAPPPLPHEEAAACSSIIEAVDRKAREIERRWGIGRLPYLVPAEWSERFASQKLKFSRACFEMNLADVRLHGAAMERAYDKIEEIAISNGHIPDHGQVWEFEIEPGKLVMLVRDRAEMAQADTKGREAQIWSLDEIVEVIRKFPVLSAAKDAFSGAEVVSIRPDPAASAKINDILDDEIPF